MIVTKKIKLSLLDFSDFSKLKELDYKNRLAHNAVVNTFYTLNAFKDMYASENESLTEKTKELSASVKDLISLVAAEKDEKKKIKLEKELEKTRKEISKLNIEVKKEAGKLIQDFFGCSEQNLGYRALNKFDLPSTVSACISSNVAAYLKSEFIEVMRGDRSIRNYRKATPIPSMKNTFRFHEENGTFFFGWRLRDDYNFQFRCKVKGELISTLRRIISNEYKICDSSVQVDGKDIYCLLSVDIPNKVRVLQTDRVLGVDLGIKYPAYYATNFSEWVKGGLGSLDSFLKVRVGLQRKKEHAQKSVLLASGGKGRDKKVQSVDIIKEKERNFAKTYNHQLSAEIIKVAVRYQCGIIKLEKLTKEGFDNRLLRNWSYYELQSMIEYKAKMNGIQVLYVNPAYTSQTCSECGNVHKDNRQSQALFKCNKCGFETNADYNASVNIAKSEQYV